MKRKKQILSIILASFMVLSVVATCGSATIDSLASSGSDLSGESLVSKYGLTTDDILNYSDYVASDIYDENNYLPINGHYSSFDFSSYIEYTSLAEWGSVDYDTTCYAFYKQGYVRYTVFPKDSFFACNGSGENALYVPLDSLNSSSDLMQITTYGNGNYTWFDNLSNTGVGTATVDNVDYYIYYLNQSIEIIGATNAAIYSAANPYGITSLDGLSQGNYSDGYNSLNPSKVSQHESLRSGSGIYLDNSTCNSGTVNLVANADTTQTSANGYKIRYWATCSYTIQMPNNLTGSNISMKNILSQYGINATAGGQYTVQGQYYYQDKPYQEIGLTVFNTNGGLWSENFAQTNNYITASGKSISTLASKIASGATWTENAVDGLATVGTQFTSANVSGYSWNNKKLGAMLSDNYSVTNISYTFHMALYKNDVLCGEISQPYTLASSSGSTGRGVGADTLTGSDEEYEKAATQGQTTGSYDNDYAPVNDISVSSGGTSSSSNNPSSSNVSISTGSDGENSGITINNNVNAYGGSATSSSDSSSSGFGSFLSTLISLLANGQSASSDTIMGMTDANGFMDVANTTLSTVPTDLWTVLLTTFSVCIAISIVAVVIGLLLKIFT